MISKVYAIGFNRREFICVQREAPTRTTDKDGTVANARDLLKSISIHFHLENLHGILKLEDGQRFSGGFHQETRFPRSDVLLGGHLRNERGDYISDLGDHRSGKRWQHMPVAVDGDTALDGLPES
jgi:hypothetical protein